METPALRYPRRRPPPLAPPRTTLRRLHPRPPQPASGPQRARPRRPQLRRPRNPQRHARLRALRVPGHRLRPADRGGGMNHLLTWAIIGALLLAAAGFASLALACCALAARADRRSEQAAPTLRCLRCGRVR